MLIVAVLLATRLFAGDLQIFGDTYRFTEGPAADKDGHVYFTDIPAERIYKWSVGGKITLYREDTGQANGLFFDRDGSLIACEGGNKRVTSISADGQVTVLADMYDGKPLNKPNDLWIDPKGGIYFTDPNYGKLPMTQDGEHVYYITPDRSKVVRVIDDFVRPNGILGTPDGKTLFVADNGAGLIWKYSISPDGTLTGKTLFAECKSDGMTLDAHGNLYATETSVVVFNPAGERIHEIKTPERPTNVTFGGKDGKTLFITARKHVCAIDAESIPAQ
jgi:gluconolactonase